jgi:hypothetical protein
MYVLRIGNYERGYEVIKYKITSRSFRKRGFLVLPKSAFRGFFPLDIHVGNEFVERMLVTHCMCAYADLPPERTSWLVAISVGHPSQYFATLEQQQLSW